MIDSKESIPPAYVVLRAGTITLFLLGSEPPLVVLKFQHSFTSECIFEIPAKNTEKRER